MSAVNLALSRRGLLGGMGAASLAALSGTSGAQPASRLPQRVIALAGHACAHVSVLGIRPIGVNLGTYTAGLRTAIYGESWQPEAVGNSDYSVDAERVTALRPDLIICNTDEEYALFEGVAPCVAMRDFTSLEQMKADLRMRAAQWGVTDAVESRIARFEARLALYSQAIAVKPSLVVISAGDNGRVNFLRQDNCVVDALRAVATPSVPIASASLRWLEGSVETLLEHDPDSLMILTFLGRPKAIVEHLWRKNPLWRELRAARTGRVAVIRGLDALHLHSLPTIAQLVDKVVPALHPAVFPTPLGTADILGMRSG